MAINRRAWIRVIEAFLSAMLVIVIVVLVVNQQQSTQSTDKTSQIYGSEISIIRTIEFNDSLRSDVLGVSLGSLPINSGNSTFPSQLNDTITSLSGSLNCEAQICQINSTCDYMKNTNTELYAQESLFFANSSIYSPRKFKLFCWMA